MKYNIVFMRLRSNGVKFVLCLLTLLLGWGSSVTLLLCNKIYHIFWEENFLNSTLHSVLFISLGNMIYIWNQNLDRVIFLASLDSLTGYRARAMRIFSYFCVYFLHTYSFYFPSKILKILVSVLNLTLILQIKK